MFHADGRSLGSSVFTVRETRNLAIRPPPERNSAMRVSTAGHCYRADRSRRLPRDDAACEARRFLFVAESELRWAIYSTGEETRRSCDLERADPPRVLNRRLPTLS